MDEIPIESIAEFTDQIRKVAQQHEGHQHLRVWFRGVPSVRFDLVPIVYRGASRENLLDDERHAFRDFKLWSAGIIPSGLSLDDLYFQQQHHGLPTRLLDWTTNALVAMYFAVEKLRDEPAAVYIMTRMALGGIPISAWMGSVTNVTILS